MKIKTITADKKQIHFFLGTPGLLTVHCKELVNVLDVVQFNALPNRKFRVDQLTETKKSNYFNNHRFYEIRFSVI